MQFSCIWIKRQGSPCLLPSFCVIYFIVLNFVLSIMQSSLEGRSLKSGHRAFEPTRSQSTITKKPTKQLRALQKRVQGARSWASRWGWSVILTRRQQKTLCYAKSLQFTRARLQTFLLNPSLILPRCKSKMAFKWAKITTKILCFGGQLWHLLQSTTGNNKSLPSCRARGMPVFH